MAGAMGTPSVPGSEEPHQEGAAGGRGLTSMEVVPRSRIGSGATSIDFLKKKKKVTLGNGIVVFLHVTFVFQPKVPVSRD